MYFDLHLWNTTEPSFSFANLTENHGRATFRMHTAQFNVSCKTIVAILHLVVLVTIDLTCYW